jgi:gluconolactonase
MNRPQRSVLGCLLALAVAVARAEEGAPADLLPTLGSIERLDPRFDALGPRDAVIEVLASGFIWAEGPVWLKAEQAILFSDIPRNRVMRFKDGEGLSVFLKPAGSLAREPMVASAAATALRSTGRAI